MFYEFVFQLVCDLFPALQWLFGEDFDVLTVARHLPPTVLGTNLYRSLLGRNQIFVLKFFVVVAVLLPLLLLFLLLLLLFCCCCCCCVVVVVVFVFVSPFCFDTVKLSMTISSQCC